MKLANSNNREAEKYTSNFHLDEEGTLYVR